MPRRVGLLIILVCTLVLVIACGTDYSGEYGVFSEDGLFYTMKLDKDGSAETNIFSFPVKGTYTVKNNQLTVKTTTVGFNASIQGKITEDAIIFADLTLKKGATSADISEFASLVNETSQPIATATPEPTATIEPTQVPEEQPYEELERARALIESGKYEEAIDAFYGVYFDIELDLREDVKDYYFNYNMKKNIPDYDVNRVQSQLAKITDLTIEEKDYIFFEAMRYLRTGQYDYAMAGFSVLGNHLDSSAWVEICKSSKESLDYYTYGNTDRGIVLKEYSGYETTIVVPIGVISLQDGNDYFGGVFRGNTRVQKIVLPDTLTTIGICTFAGCTNLREIQIPNSVKRINNSAFANSGIESISVPSSVTSFSYGIFHGCANLKEVEINCEMSSLPSSTFRDCSSLTKFVVPEGVMYIYQNCFAGCTNLETITLPSTLLEFSEWCTFENCTSLKTIILPEGMVYLGWDTFSGCSSLEEIVIPEGVTSLEGSVFSDCTALNSVTLPSRLNSISYGTFANCTNITELSIPRTVKKIEWDSFSNMYSTHFKIYEGSYAQKYFDERKEYGHEYITFFITN